MCCMSFFLLSRLHHRTITYGRANITSNFPIKLVISQTAILCSACYFWKPTDVPSSRVIFILFISHPHILLNIVLSAFWHSLIKYMMMMMISIPSDLAHPRAIQLTIRFSAPNSKLPSLQSLIRSQHWTSALHQNLKRLVLSGILYLGYLFKPLLHGC